MIFKIFKTNKFKHGFIVKKLSMRYSINYKNELNLESWGLIFKTLISLIF